MRCAVLFMTNAFSQVNSVKCVNCLMFCSKQFTGKVFSLVVSIIITHLLYKHIFWHTVCVAAYSEQRFCNMCAAKCLWSLCCGDRRFIFRDETMQAFHSPTTPRAGLNVNGLKTSTCHYLLTQYALLCSEPDMAHKPRAVPSCPHTHIYTQTVFLHTNTHAHTKNILHRNNKLWWSLNSSPRVTEPLIHTVPSFLAHSHSIPHTYTNTQTHTFTWHTASGLG